MITVDGVGVGLTTCYDIRFPELYVELAQRGAQLITVHASWGIRARASSTSGPCWPRARALDATSVVAAVDQAYPGDEVAAAGPTGVGGSLVCFPTGDVLAVGGCRPAALLVPTSTSIPSRRPATPSRCSATAPSSHRSGRAQSLG